MYYTHNRLINSTRVSTKASLPLSQVPLTDLTLFFASLFFVVPHTRLRQYAQQSISIQTNSDAVNIRIKAMVSSPHININGCLE